MMIVSIPNGMEFYPFSARLWLEIHCFNSQRDGILQCAGYVVLAGLISFNSQRDGILRKDSFPPNTPEEFQFPTGWNSTRFIRIWHRGVKVSIPNGMEFYNMFYRYQGYRRWFQFPTGWNSTMRHYWKTEAQRVSIPNGMEFYFNSFIFKSSPLVSIPNGMEFYKTKWKRKNRNRKFQFPTGWNSTETKFW